MTVVFPELRPPSPRLRRAGERVEQMGLAFFDVDLRFRLCQVYGGQGVSLPKMLMAKRPTLGSIAVSGLTA